MKTPPWLIGAALLFWGWENGLLLWGILLTALLEGSRLTRTRWELSNGDLNRISDLSAALFLGTALLLYSTSEDRLNFVFRLAQWLPMCFCPIMLAQAYGNREKFPLSVFWWLLRRSPETPTASKAYNISYCYFSLCVLSASASTRADRFFYAGITLLVAFALTSARPRRVSLVTWVILLTIAAGTGQFSHQGLRQAQTAMEGTVGTWIAEFLGGPMDPHECQTKIGRSGQIPQSGKIILRLRPEPGALIPGLLREAVWDAYKKQIWTASNNEFAPMHSGANDIVNLLPTNTLSSKVEIASYFPNGEGMVPLPHGTFEVDNLPALVSTNRLGAMKIDSGPGLIDMDALFGPGRSFDSPPCDRDLIVPDEEKPALDAVVAELKLNGLTERQKIRAVDQFFILHFTYTLNVPRHRERLNQPTPLAYFLTRSHMGHCEYFATATVLLLREAGVPARYATGYAVPETARRGDTYLIRSRDEHAWALVYHSDSKSWEQLDTTPSSRGHTEGTGPPWWEPASDALSNLYFQFSKWRWSKTSYARYSTWVLVPLIIYLAVRIIWNQRRHRPPAETDASKPPWPGLDSELYWIDRQLANSPLSRRPNELLRSWQERMEAAFPDSDRLRQIFHLHRRLRFDPRGLAGNDREILRHEAQRWLADFTTRAEAEKQNASGAQLRASG